MNRDDFIAHFRHEFMGIMLEAARNKEDGGRLGIMLDMWIKKIELRLGQAWDRLQPPKPSDAKPPQPANNGHKQEAAKR